MVISCDVAIGEIEAVVGADVTVATTGDSGSNNVMFILLLVLFFVVFSCANRERVLGEVVGVGLSNAEFQFEDAGIAGTNNSIFVRDSLFEGYDAGLFLGYYGVFVGKAVGHFLLDTVGEFNVSGDGSVDGTGGIDGSGCMCGGS